MKGFKHATHFIYLFYVFLLFSLSQLLILLTLTLMTLVPSLCSPTGGCAMDEEISPACIPTLSDYYTQVTNLPSRLNERSLAPWTYV